MRNDDCTCIETCVRTMGFVNNANCYIEVLLVLLLLMSSLCIGHQNKCTYSKTKINCPGAGLREIPKSIPLTVIEINLSHNPLLHIDSSYFLKFPNLRALFLRDVGQRGPIFLPKSLTTLDFSDNSATIDSLTMMLHGQSSLQELKLEGMNLNINDILSILPKGIQSLMFSGNRLTTLKWDDLKCCSNLTSFYCNGCSLKVIEPKAFDNVKGIADIVLSYNEIRELPDGIFKGLPNLSTINMRGNKLEEFNASKVGVKNLRFLELGHNIIKTIDLQYSEIQNIGLQSNRIGRLDRSSFGTKPFVYEFALQRNRINEISPRTFENVSLVSALILHGNNIEKLPRNLLKRTLVNMLFLHNNDLSTIDEFILAMKKPPYLLTLFSNKKLKHFNTSVFKGINKRYRIFISCNDMDTINLSSKKSTSITCCPSSELILATPFDFMAYGGYECNFVGNTRLFHCHACQTGFYGASNAAYRIRRDCTSCPAGSFYQDELASLHCKNCPIGQYVPPSRSPGKDASDCQTCPQGTNTSKSAGTRACSCLKGYHRRFRFGACEKCEHVGFECVRDYPQLKEGFWMTWNGTGSSNCSCKQEFQSFILNLETFSNEYDRNTMQFNCELPIPIKCPKHGSCRGGLDSKCSPGYTGVLCGVCSKGYKSQLNSCVKCPKIYLVILKWIGFIALFILLCYIVSDKKNDNHGNTRMEPSNDEERPFVDIFISNFKILIGFYQTLIGVMNAYSIINWPNNLMVIISIMEYIQFEVIRIPSLRCINPKWAIDSVDEFWLSLIVYVAVPVFCLLYYITKSCYFRCQKMHLLDVAGSRNFCWRNCVRFAAFFMFITFPLLATRIVHVLPESCETICTVKNNGVCAHKISFLRSDYSVNCPTISTHRYTLIAAYSSLIALCCLPILLWVTMRNLRQKGSIHIPLGNNIQCVTFIREDGMERNSGMEDRYDDGDVHSLLNDVQALGSPSVFKYALRFTYENYKDKFWYWEVIEMARKFIMTVGAALFFYNTKVGLSILIIVGIAFAILHAIRKPMKDRFENFLQMLSLWIVPINLSAGAVIQSTVDGMNRPRGNDPESWKVGIFLIVINSLVIMLIIGRFGKLALQKVIEKVC